MIYEIAENVKRKILILTQNLNDYITRPQQKYMIEMVSGVFATKSLNLTSIAGYLNERCGVKHSLKRLQRNTFNYSTLLDISNAYNIDYAYNETKSDDRLIISIDGGDLTHDYGIGFELIGKVHDGSSNKVGYGYPLNHAVCYSPKSKRMFSLYIDVYSYKSSNFKSENAKTIEMLEKIGIRFKDKGLFVFDRGYDRGEILRYMLRNGLSFVIRSVSKRHLDYNGSRLSVLDICKDKINRRYKKGGISYGYAKCYYHGHAVTLISVRGNSSKNMLYFMSEGHISSSKEAYFRISSYFSRWKIEESYKFMKQQFGIEKCLVRRFESLRTLLGMVSFCWNVLSQIESDVMISKLLEDMAKREKYDNEDKKVCEFKYYRISDGIERVLRSYNGKIFHHRDKKYACDYVMYFKIGYYLKFPEERKKIFGMGKMKRKKSLLVA